MRRQGVMRASRCAPLVPSAIAMVLPASRPRTPSEAGVGQRKRRSLSQGSIAGVLSWRAGGLRRLFHPGDAVRFIIEGLAALMARVAPGCGDIG